MKPETVVHERDHAFDLVQCRQRGGGHSKTNWLRTRIPPSLCIVSSLFLGQSAGCEEKRNLSTLPINLALFPQQKKLLKLCSHRPVLDVQLRIPTSERVLSIRRPKLIIIFACLVEGQKLAHKLALYVASIIIGLSVSHFTQFALWRVKKIWGV